MLHLANEDVDRLVTPSLALEAMRSAFHAWATGEAAVQARVRTECGAAKLSTLGAVLRTVDGDPDRGVLGAKVYATIRGQFTFLVLLFSAADGHVLATLEADALTRLRTGATSALGAQLLANPNPRRLVVYGSGAQARGNVEAFAAAFDLTSVVLVGRTPPADAAAELAGAIGMDVVATDDRSGPLQDADVAITATRATAPLFGHGDVPAGAHIGALGASRLDARELDTSVYAAADTVAVEWREQAAAEAGGLVDAIQGGLIDWGDVVELADLVTGHAIGRRHPTDRTVLHTVGVGLEDIALAAVAWRAATAEGR